MNENRTTPRLHRWGKHGGPRARQQGYLMVVAVVLIVIGAVFATTLSFLYVSSAFTSVGHLASMQAFFAAEAGLERGTRALLSPVLAATAPLDPERRLACAAITGGPNLTDAAIGSGQFTVTGSAPTYAVTATLSGVHDQTTTTINVSSTAGYAPSGRLMIDRELIDYSAIAGNSFVGARRAAAGSSAAAHANGTRVSQNQCDLISHGGAPSLAAPDGQRTLRQGVQLQEGWAVGANGTIFRWDTTAWTAAASPVGVQLNSVSMLSYGDGWAVGTAGAGAAQRPLILHWNGAAWATRNSNLNINVGLNSVYCVATDDCWAVGDVQGGPGGGEVILRWNGAAWSRVGPSAAVPDQNLNSVYCVSTNDCWSVGQAGAGAAQRPLILYWNGAAWATRNSNLNINANLNGVHCVTSRDCWAVGNAAGGELLLHWDGSAWTRLPASGALADQNLFSVNIVGAPQTPTTAWHEQFP
jgi:hypothetical protein